jgi:hypothetical protein
MEPSAVIDLVDGAGKVFSDVGKVFERRRIDGLGL